MGISTNWFRFNVAAVMASSVLALSACGAEDGSDEAGGDEPSGTSEQAIIPGSTLTQVFKTYVIPPNGSLTKAEVGCPSGSIAVGGGHFTAGSVQVYSSERTSNGWMISVINLSTTATAPIDVYAQCLAGTAARASLFWATSNPISANGTGSKDVVCPGGTILSGGGYHSESSAFAPYANYPASLSAPGWRVRGQNKNPGSSMTFRVQAVCLSGVTGAAEILLAPPSGSIGAGSKLKFSTPACPSGTLLSSGGHYGSDTSKLTALGNLRNHQNPAVWTAVVLNGGTTATTANMNAVCLNIWP